MSVITRPVGVVSRRPFERKTVLGLAEQGPEGRKRGVKEAILDPSRTLSKRLALPRQNRMAVAPSKSKDSTRRTSRLSATRRRYLHRRPALLSFSSLTLPGPAMERDRLIARRPPIEKHRALFQAPDARFVPSKRRVIQTTGGVAHFGQLLSTSLLTSK